MSIEITKQDILGAVCQHSESQCVADALGIKIKTLHRKIGRFGIRDQFRDSVNLNKYKSPLPKKNTGGTYRLYVVGSRFSYYGSSAKLRDRARDHLSSLRRGKHDVRDLQADYEKFGCDAVMFEVIEYLPVEALRDSENFLIAAHVGESYNKNGSVHTVESRRRSTAKRREKMYRQNPPKKSGVVGVYWHRVSGSWKVSHYDTETKTRTSLGYWNTLSEAKALLDQFKANFREYSHENKRNL